MDVPSGSSASTDAPVVSARILKKRETDRKCQRMIRERTKSRIAYLEGLVEQFREQDSSGRLETMMKQLGDMTDERDALVKKVKNIESIISDDKLKEDLDPSEFPSIKVRSDSEDELPLRLGPRRDFNGGPASPNGDPVPGTQNVPSYLAFNKQYVGHLENTNTLNWSSQSLQAAPQAQQGCECLNSLPPPSPASNISRWRYANNKLTEWFDWSPQMLDMRNNYAYNDDIPVRAIVEGWDAVEQQGNMHPVWRLLRSIDQNIFGSLDPRERLGTLRLMGWLLFAHINPTREQHIKLPSFYLKRPSQDMLGAYAVEFFAWPGLRERFVYSEHRYCSSAFWRLYCQNLHIQWPYEFRDCYTHNTDTGLYNISPTFHERICDIRSWTMGRDMFKQYPELYSDIPTHNHIPASLNPTSPLGTGRKPLPRASMASATNNKGKAPERRVSQPVPLPETPLTQPLQPRALSIDTIQQVYSNPPSVNQGPFGGNISSMSTSFTYSPLVMPTTTMNIQNVPALTMWGYNTGADIFHANPDSNG